MFQEKNFYPTAFKGYVKIVFTHFIQMVGLTGVKSLPGLYLRIPGYWLEGVGMQHHITLFALRNFYTVSLLLYLMVFENLFILHVFDNIIL